MFGLFKSRKTYNGTVDAKLHNEYQIKTRENALFPGTLAYLRLLDDAWARRMNEDEAAMFVACCYYTGLIKHGHGQAALPVRDRINSVGQFGVENQMISIRWVAHFMSIIEAG